MKAPPAMYFWSEGIDRLFVAVLGKRDWREPSQAVWALIERCNYTAQNWPAHRSYLERAMHKREAALVHFYGSRWRYHLSDDTPAIPANPGGDDARDPEGDHPIQGDREGGRGRAAVR